MNILFFLAVLAGFALTAVITPLIIPVLRKLKFGQQIRKEGNPDHLKKQGTPTMGGLVFVPVILVLGGLSTLIFPEFAPAAKVLPVLVLAFLLGIVGFIDDYLKIVKKQSEGLKAWQKLLLQSVIAAGFAVYAYLSPAIGDAVILPFTGSKTWNMGWLYLPFVFFAIVGTDNGTNFTDGLDGLLGTISFIVFGFLFFLSEKLGSGSSLLSAIAAGAVLGYLMSNTYPARIFMGDTGSLAIGGFVAGIAIVSKAGWFILLFGLLYLIEVISVILQVGYFKLTHGKRLFKMAPIHHHFEKLGFKETQVVAMFAAFTILMCLLAAVAL